METRILFTESSRNLGGQELQLLHQLAALRGLGVEARLICRPGAQIGERARAQGVAVDSAPFARALDATSIRIVRRILRDWHPAAIIAHGSPDLYTAYLARSGTRTALLRVKTYHTGGHSNWLHTWLADAVLVPSDFLRRRIAESRLVRMRSINPTLPHLASR